MDAISAFPAQRARRQVSGAISDLTTSIHYDSHNPSSSSTTREAYRDDQHSPTMSSTSSSSANGDHYQSPGPGLHLTRDHSRGSTSASSTTSTLVARDASPRLGGGFKAPWLATNHTADSQDDHEGESLGSQHGWSIDIDASRGLLHEKQFSRNYRRSSTAPFAAVMAGARTGRRWINVRRATLVLLMACAGFLALTCAIPLLAPGMAKGWSHKIHDGLQQSQQIHLDTDAKAWLEPQWEWARNVSVVYTWVVSLS